MLSHRLCTEINEGVVCIHPCAERDNGSRIGLVVNAADIKTFPTEHYSF